MRKDDRGESSDWEYRNVSTEELNDYLKQRREDIAIFVTDPQVGKQPMRWQHVGLAAQRFGYHVIRVEVPNE